MARAWEADFIRLWEAGATQAQIAQALGIPHGTVKSRAHRLQQQGTIQTRQAEAHPPGQTRERPPSTLPPWTLRPGSCGN
jgi:predicted ArsR family transcriptional regulator